MNFQSIQAKLLTSQNLTFTLRCHLNIRRNIYMSTTLIISAIAPNRPGMANDIAHLIQEFGTTILESHMTVMSNEFTVIMEVTGPWNALAKLEHQLPMKAHKLGMLTMLKRSDKLSEEPEWTAYRVIIDDVKDRGIINQVTSFFAENQVNIEEVNCRTFLAPQSEALIGELKMTVTLDNTQPFDDLRSKFEQFCAASNLKAEITPLKNC